MPSIFHTEDLCSRGCLTLAGIAGLVIWVYSTLWGGGFMAGLTLGLVCTFLGGASLRWLICDGRQAQPGDDLPTPLPVAVTRGADWGQHVRNVFTDDGKTVVASDPGAPEVRPLAEPAPESAPVTTALAEPVVAAEAEPVPVPEPMPVAAAVAGTAEPVSIAVLPEPEEEPALASGHDPAAPAVIAAAKPAPAGGAPQESLDATGKMKKRPKEKSGKDKSGKGKKDRDVKAGGKAKKDKKSRKGDQPVQVPQQNAPAPESASVAAPVLTITTAEPKRAKKSDDLKEIKGIGPKYEKMLNNLGYRRFKHIAAWTEADIARMQEVMPNFDNRIRSENWIGQAAELAARTGKDRK